MKSGNPGIGLLLPPDTTLLHFVRKRATDFNYTATTPTAKKFNKTGLISENVLKYIYIFVHQFDTLH